jgi:hypothetical protein
MTKNTKTKAVTPTKLKNGSIYDYNGRTVRLRQTVGAVCTLREPHGAIFIGRTNMLKRVGKTRVEKFVAKCS